MADRLVAIRKLLTHAREERRSAAAIVLAELGVKDNRSITALLKTVDDEDPQVRRYVIEALGQAEAEQAVDKIVGAMNDPDPQVQKAAGEAVRRLGDRAVPALQRMMEGPVTARRKAATVLSQLQSAGGLESLVDTVDGNDAAVLDRARQALRTQAPDLSTADLRKIRKRLDQRLAEARHNRANGSAAALLQMLGDLPDETVVTRIVKEVEPNVPVNVRRAALSAMMNALPISRGRRREAGIEKLLECLTSDDEDEIIRPTLRALQDIDIPERFTEQLERLDEAPSAAVRAYALSQLGRRGSPDSVTTLVEQLVEGSAPLRAAAIEALENTPDAAGPLAQALLEAKDATRQQDIAELLRKHQEALPEKDLTHLSTAVMDLVEAGEREGKILADIVARSLPDQFLNQLRARVVARREGRKISEAYDLLKVIKNCPVFGEEEQYQLAILGLLKESDTKRRPPGSANRICTPFAELLRSGFPIETRLATEKLVSLKDLYYLGFAFSESRDDDEREFGHELLEEVAEREPDGEYGSRAQNKLKLTRR